MEAAIASGGRSPKAPSPQDSAAPLPKIQVKSQDPITRSPPSKSRSNSPPRQKSPRSHLKSPQACSPKTPSFVPKNVITPVFPKSPEDMVGAQTGMDTGLTYPYNAWGPVTKYGHLDDVPPKWPQKKHFGGQHDKLAKKRLTARRFCHIRHPAYKELIEPEEHKSTLYIDPKQKEFWRTDVINVLLREENQRRDRYKKLLQYIGNEQAWRDSELRRDREDRWQAYRDFSENVKYEPGFRNNQSGVKYNIITRKPTDAWEEKKTNYQEAKARYRQAQRSLYLQERMSGARPYNIISWLKMPPCRTLPPWPVDIGSPPGPNRDPRMIPLNSSKGALSFAYVYGPFGTIP